MKRLLTLAAATALVSCSAEKVLENGKTAAETIGFTTAAGYYAFDPEISSLEEGADRILAMGSKVIKLWLTADPQNCYTYNTDWSEYRLDNCVDILKSDYYQAALDKPFSTYVFETHTYDATSSEFAAFWQDGMSENEMESTESQMYDVTKYLLETYNGTGKTFLLQNWEGDNMLGNEHWKHNKLKDIYHLETVSPENADKETDIKIRTAIRGMTDWFNARQAGVDRAKAELAGKIRNVNVLHVFEANFTRADYKDDWYEGHPLLITPWVAADTPMVIEDVVPYTDCDLYSLSCWGATSMDRANTMQVRIEQYEAYIGDSYIDIYDSNKVKPRRPFYREGQVSRLMLGEYGAAERAQSGDKAWEYTKELNYETDRRQREVVQIQTDIAIKKGLEYILYWQIYCNDALVGIENPITRAEANAGKKATTDQLKGYWVIRPDGSYTESYKYFKGILDKKSLLVSEKHTEGKKYSVKDATDGFEIKGRMISGSQLSNLENKDYYRALITVKASKNGKDFEEIPVEAFYTSNGMYGRKEVESDMVFINRNELDPDYRYFTVETNHGVPDFELNCVSIYRKTN